VIQALEDITDIPEKVKKDMQAVIDRVWPNVRDRNGNLIVRAKTEGTQGTTSAEGSQSTERAERPDGERVPGPYESELMEAFRDD
jgi:hypothetical protein